MGGCEGGMLCERRKAEGGRDGGTKGQREGVCVCVCVRERDRGEGEGIEEERKRERRENGATGVKGVRRAREGAREGRRRDGAGGGG